jgi:hypothetical protein
VKKATIGGKSSAWSVLCSRFDVAAPSWLRVHYNGAGLITVLEIGYQEGKMVLRFAGAPALGSGFTANSWGERHRNSLAQGDCDVF